MDEFERRLRESMGRAVDGWTPALDAEAVSPAPAQVRRRPYPLALAVLVALVLGGTGIAIGLGGGHGGGKPATLAADPTLPPPSSAVATPSPTCPVLPTPSNAFAEMAGVLCANSIATPAPASCPSASPEAVYGTDGSVTCTATGPLPPPVPGLSSPAVATGSPTATEAATSASASTSPTPAVAPCAKGNFTVKVRTDRSSYSEKDPVRVDVSVTSDKTCDTPDYYNIIGYIHEGTASGRVVESFGTGCDLHDGVDPKCPFVPSVPPSHTLKHWKAGEVETASDTWNQVVVANDPPTYADATSYDVEVTAGDVSGSQPFAIVAPDCTIDQLAATFVPGQPSYAQGSTATFTGTLSNISATPCRAGVDNRVDTPAMDSAGQQVWSGGCSSGRAFGAGHCPVTAQRIVPGVLQPGEAVSMTKQWDLTADGTDSHPDPGPVPAGTYTVTWTYAGQVGQPATASATITVTAATPSAEATSSPTP